MKQLFSFFFRRLWILFFLISLTVAGAEPFGPPLGSVTVKGLTMYVTPPLFRSTTTVVSSPRGSIHKASNELKDYEMFLEIVLKNESEKTLQVVTSSNHGPKKNSQGGQIDYYYFLPKVRGLSRNVYVKPKPSELDIVTLNPGESTCLGGIRCSFDHETEGDNLVFIYHIQDLTADYYPVWTGDITLKIPYEAIVAWATRPDRASDKVTTEDKSQSQPPR